MKPMRSQLSIALLVALSLLVFSKPAHSGVLVGTGLIAAGTGMAANAKVTTAPAIATVFMGVITALTAIVAGSVIIAIMPEAVLAGALIIVFDEPNKPPLLGLPDYLTVSTKKSLEGLVIEYCRNQGCGVGETLTLSKISVEGVLRQEDYSEEHVKEVVKFLCE